MWSGEQWSGEQWSRAVDEHKLPYKVMMVTIAMMMMIVVPITTMNKNMLQIKHLLLY